MSVTAKDLAKKLHLSEAAVSMALNGKTRRQHCHKKTGYRDSTTDGI